jgi:hypothetical protein
MSGPPDLSRGVVEGKIPIVLVVVLVLDPVR